MKEEEMIAKAKKALNYIGVMGEYAISVLRTEDELILGIDESLKDEYVVAFNYRLPDGRMAHHEVRVDKKTDKLLYMTAGHITYEIPEDLR